MMASVDQHLPQHRQDSPACISGQPTQTDFAQPAMDQYDIHAVRLVAMTLLLFWGAVALALWQLL